MTRAAIMVRIEEPGWRHRAIDIASIRAAARLALTHGLKHKGERNEAHRKPLTILLASDDRLRELNARFRSKQRATNVLSFPASPGDGYFGDIALALGVAEREAAAEGKRLSDHVLHLTVHGVLSDESVAEFSEKVIKPQDKRPILKQYFEIPPELTAEQLRD